MTLRLNHVWWGAGVRGSHGKRQADTHTFTKLTTGLTGWSVVVDFKTYAVLKRRPHTAPLDTDPVLLVYYLQRKTLHCLSAPSPQPSISTASNNLVGRKTQDTTTCVHHNVPSKVRIPLGQKKIHISECPEQADIGYATIKWKVCSKIQIVLF